MDKNFVYFTNLKTPILPENFENVRAFDAQNPAFVSDGVTVYIGVTPMPNLDAKSFGVIPLTDYYFDKNGIYGQFENENGQYAFGKFSFVYNGDVSAENTFLAQHIDRFEGEWYIVYKNQAWSLRERKLYRNLSPQQITLAKEGKLNIVTKGGKIVEKQRMFPNGVYEAGGKIYFRGKETIADAQTFENIGWGTYINYFKDKNYVYSQTEFGLTPLKGIDVKTAKIVARFLADKNYLYFRESKIIKNDNVELIAIFYIPEGNGYRENVYLLKNSEGYWLVDLGEEERVVNLGRF